MKNLLPLFTWLICLLTMDAYAQQASCRSKLELDAPAFSCSVTITPDMINFGSFNYDQLVVIDPIIGAGTHQVGLVAISGAESDTCFTTVTVYDKTKPVLILHQNIVLDLGATGHVNLIPGMVNSGSYDYCSPVSFVLSPSFVDCDSPNPTKVTVVAFDSTGNYSEGTTLVYVENKIVATTSLVCNDGVVVNVGPAGSILLDADDILEGGPYKCPSYYRLVLLENSVPRPKAEVNAGDVGKVFQAVVTDPSTGNSCWGSLTVALSPCTGPDLCDTKSNCEPVTDCTGGHSSDDNIEWPCDIEAGYKLVLDEKPTPAVLKNVLGLPLSNVEPITVNNECSQIVTTYTDQRIQLPDGVKILRTWSALNWLSGKVVSYLQTIRLINVELNSCFICDTLAWNTPITDCAGGHTDQDAVEWPADITVHTQLISPQDLEQNPEVNIRNARPEITASCDNYFLSYTDTYTVINDSTSFVVRNWSIFDFGTLEYGTFTQNITVISDVNANQRTVCIKSMNGSAVEGVQLQTNVITTGDVCTSFDFDPSQSLVAPSKMGDAADGIDIEDASMLLDHILGIEPLNDFQKLAADVNLDGQVTSFDLLTILKLITGDQTTLDKVWRFFYLPVGESNFSLPLSEQADVSSPFQTYFFKGIKMGDLNDDNSSNGNSSYESANLILKDDIVYAGQSTKFAITTDRDHYASALQVEFVKSDDMDFFIPICDLGLYGTETIKDLGDKYIYSWLANDQIAKSGGVYLPKGSILFNVKMISKSNSILSNMIHITSEINNKLRSNKAIPTYLLTLKVEDQITTSVVDQNDQNNWMPVPNPTSDQVVLLNAHNIKAIDLYTSTGQLIESWNTAVTQLNLSHVAPGAYLIRASHNDATTSVKPLFIIR